MECEFCKILPPFGDDHPPSIHGYMLLRHKRTGFPLIVATSHDKTVVSALDQAELAEATRLLMESNPLPKGYNYVPDFLRELKGRNGHTRLYIRQTPEYQAMRQELADAITGEAQEACRWFFESPPPEFSAVYTDAAISDEDVERRIQGFQYALDREVARYSHFEFEGGWDWRFDTDWRERHAAWVERYKEREGEIVAQVQGAPLRLDLTELPWERQRALVSRWQALWEKEALNGA